MSLWPSSNRHVSAKDVTVVQFYLGTQNKNKMEINEIKKDLYKSKAMAKFSHYEDGKLFYTIDVGEEKFIFPIATVENDYIEPEFEGEDEREILKLSEDLGKTKFHSEIRGSELIRWISKSIDKNEFIKIG
jgi:hypothetical protein